MLGTAPRSGLPWVQPTGVLGDIRGVGGEEGGLSVSLRIEKEYLRGALHFGASFHNCNSGYSISYISWKVVYFSF